MTTRTAAGCEGACKTTVQQVCSEPVITVPQFMTMEQAACELVKNRISALVVVDETEHFIGILTSADLVRYFAQKSNLCADELLAADTRVTTDGQQRLNIEPFPVESVIRHMTTVVQTVTPETSVAKARQMMTHQRVHHLLLLDQQSRPAGIVSSMDLL